MAPDVVQPRVVDHLSRQPDGQASPRKAMAEAARIARGRIRDIATVKDNDIERYRAIIAKLGLRR